MKILTIFIAIIFMFNTNIYASDELNGFDTNNIEKTIEEKTDLSFSKLFYNAIEGNFDDVIDDIKNSVINAFLKEIKDNITYLKSIIVISILCGILNIVANDLKDKSIAQLIFFVGQILVIGISIVAFRQTIDLLKTVANDISEIIQSAIPLMVGILSVGGKSATAISCGGMLGIVTGILANIVDGVIVPLIIVTTLIKIVNIISQRDMLNKMSKLFYEITCYLIKGGGYLFVFLMSFQKISGGIMNNTIKGSAKSIVGAIPVVGDVVKGGMDVASNIASGVASGTSVVLVIVMLLCAIVPIVKIFVISMMYKLLAAIAEPICDKGTIEIIDSIGDGCKLILGATFMILFMFVISILVVLGGII